MEDWWFNFSSQIDLLIKGYFSLAFNFYSWTSVMTDISLFIFFAVYRNRLSWSLMDLIIYSSKLANFICKVGAGFDYYVSWVSSIVKRYQYNAWDFLWVLELIIFPHYPLLIWWVILNSSSDFDRMVNSTIQMFDLFSRSDAT